MDDLETTVCTGRSRKNSKRVSRIQLQLCITAVQQIYHLYCIRALIDGM